MIGYKNSICFIRKSAVLFLALFAFTSIFPQAKPVLKFNKEGKFKILQFTDVHFRLDHKFRCDTVVETIKMMVERTKPDLVVFTGDNVTSDDFKTAWEQITRPIISAGIPWAAVFGNHDHEHGFTNKQIMDFLVTMPLSLSEQGPENISGSGNYILGIKGAQSGKNEALLYFFDSHDYTWNKKDKELGEYGWVAFDQIAWYRAQSKAFTEKNGGKPFPAFAFLHIPVPEYSEAQKKTNTIGDKDETVCSPKINSGLYSAFLESKDVIGVFCGHDHENNFIGTLNNIALVYGCKTGRDSYGKLDKGGRVIVLYEGERKFDTWITTEKDSVKYFTTYPDSFIIK
jgi:3',5'-cyclic AMP phosphodiesterase CpdA